MKIAHLGPSALPVLHDRGGAIQRRMVELAAEQAALGHDVRLLSADDQTSRTTHRDIQVDAVGVRLPRPWRDYEFLVKAYTSLHRDPVDLIHFHGVPDGARLARLLCCRSALSFDYFRFRFSTNSLGWSYYRRALRRFDLLLPVSDACANLATEFWGPMPWKVMPNGVNLVQFHPDPSGGLAVRRRLGISADQLVVLYVGRLCSQKGTDLLLDAWNLLGTPGNAALVIAGPVGQFGNRAEGALVDRLRSLGGFYLGAVDEVDLPNVYNMCDIFVMPTRNDEMFGMAALEAQAVGKPVVASRLEGLLESVSFASGRFFEPGDAIDLRRVLGYTLGSALERQEMSSEARAHAARFSWKSIARRSIDLYGTIG